MLHQTDLNRLVERIETNRGKFYPSKERFDTARECYQRTRSDELRYSIQSQIDLAVAELNRRKDELTPIPKNPWEKLDGQVEFMKSQSHKHQSIPSTTDVGIVKNSVVTDIGRRVDIAKYYTMLDQLDIQHSWIINTLFMYAPILMIRKTMKPIINRYCREIFGRKYMWLSDYANYILGEYDLFSHNLDVANLFYGKLSSISKPIEMGDLECHLLLPTEIISDRRFQITSWSFATS